MIYLCYPLSPLPPTPPHPGPLPVPAYAAVPADAAGDVGGDVPSSSPRRADAADLRPGASAANDGCRCCCKPGPAAGAAASLGPQPALQQAWARRSRRRCGPGAGDRRTWGRGINAHQLRNLMHRTCRSRFNQAERRDEPDQPKTGSNNQEDKYQDIIGYPKISYFILLYSSVVSFNIPRRSRNGLPQIVGVASLPRACEQVM